ncbi:tubby-related protein 4 isoform X2 [Lingula anatina]|uniref:Tubby-related protein 4 isoform X2 n=1 Tax=Lingula anatina TaxID=7574 RepID=A0A1S3HGH9_LINAN|nr:tubby-related protein 4 isoform X2 [Lingula anatina]|eukprot:XP_013385175.1 tubby-related protein 4 isoform X2 [Lingula anatina]
MYIFIEDSPTTRSDCTIHSLSWMGKVPEILPNEDGWQLDRSEYYQEGWLATGNGKGIVSATFTTSHCEKDTDVPSRTNFNLRGHRNEVVMVKWNEPYQKLSTCDTNGIIFVWMKHDGRWSVELVNDRNVPVTDFNWSHDGRMALITYEDGFILVGSVNGQRHWSTNLNLENATVKTGVWSPGDQEVLLGTSDGQIIVLTSSGATVTQVTILSGQEMSHMAWSCEKFSMESDGTNSPSRTGEGTRCHSLAASFKSGAIHLLSNYDDLLPVVIQTGLQGIQMEWSNDGEFLAVGGYNRLPSLNCISKLLLYTKSGTLLLSMTIPNQPKPLTALTWGHNDKRLFIATGSRAYVGRVNKEVAPLQLLCETTVKGCLSSESDLQHLPLPLKMKCHLDCLFIPTIQNYIPPPEKLRDFVILPPSDNDRFYCTMMRHGDESYGGYYILYLEYLGGHIPILKGRRNSKLRPEFVIFDPSPKGMIKNGDDEVFSSSGCSCSSNGEDEPILDTGCGSPRPRRKKKQKKRPRSGDRKNGTPGRDRCNDRWQEDHLPEENRLVEVTSNFWGTKFKFIGLTEDLPTNLGEVIYKTSLFHLQPRQMTVMVTDLDDKMEGELTAAGPLTSDFGANNEEEDLTGTFQESLVDPLRLSPDDDALPVAPKSPLLSCKPNVFANAETQTDDSAKKANLKAAVCMEAGAAGVDQINTSAIVFMAAPDGGAASNVNSGVVIGECEGATYSAQEEKVAFQETYLTHNESLCGNVDLKLLNGQPPQNGLVAMDSYNKDLDYPKSNHIESLTNDSSYDKLNALHSSPLVRRKSHLTNSDFTLHGKSHSLDLPEKEQECALDHSSFRFSGRVLSDNKLTDLKKGQNSIPQSSKLFERSQNASRKQTSNNSPNRKSTSSPKTVKIVEECKGRKVPLDSSDEDMYVSSNGGQNLKDLEGFQKSQLKQKVKKHSRSKSEGDGYSRKLHVMHNKAPIWNEANQVYQLDFGGRVTQESAKNFQIEWRGKQVMQFGRIDVHAYTLDFQHPFSAIQAFAVALANVTQRLK